MLQSVQLKLGEFVSHTCCTCSALWFSQFLDASANLDAQMKEREQGTVIVETVFSYLCHWNLVLFTVQWYIYVCNILIRSVYGCISWYWCTTAGEQTRNHDNRNHILWSVLYIETWWVLLYVLDLRRLHSNSVSYWMPRLIKMREQTRNCSNRDHILLSVQLKLGEFSRSYMFHMFSTLKQSASGCLG